MRVKDIRNQFVKKYKQKEFEIDKLGGKVIDLICAQFIADEAYIFGKSFSNKKISTLFSMFDSDSLQIFLYFSNIYAMLI